MCNTISLKFSISVFLQKYFITFLFLISKLLVPPLLLLLLTVEQVNLFLLRHEGPDVLTLAEVPTLGGDQSAQHVSPAVLPAGCRGVVPEPAEPLVEGSPLGVVGGEGLHVPAPALGGEVLQAEGGEGGKGGVLQYEVQPGPVGVVVSLGEVEVVGLVVEDSGGGLLPLGVGEVDPVGGVEAVVRGEAGPEVPDVDREAGGGVVEHAELVIVSVAIELSRDDVAEPGHDPGELS